MLGKFLKIHALLISLLFASPCLYAASVNLNVTGGLSNTDDITADDAVFTDTATFQSGVHAATLGGRVGIATVSPTDLLTVGGNTGSNFIGVNGVTNGNVGYYFYDADTLQNQIVQDQSTDILSFYGGAGWRFNENGVNGDFVIESDERDPAFHLEGSNGYVGLSTPVPTATLDIFGFMKISTESAESNLTFGLQRESSAHNSIVWYTNSLAFKTGSTGAGGDRMTLDVNGLLTVSGGSTPGVVVGNKRVGLIQGSTTSVNYLVQFASASVTADATIDFTDIGLSDYTSTPLVVLSPVYDSNDDSVLGCTPHTITATGFTIECSICSGDGVGGACAADGSARQVNFMISGNAP